MSDAFTCNGRISMDPIAYAQMGGHSAAPMANVRVLQTYTSGMCMLQVMAILGVSFSIWWFMLASDSAKATLEEFCSACCWGIRQRLRLAAGLSTRAEGEDTGCAHQSPFAKVQRRTPCKSCAGRWVPTVGAAAPLCAACADGMRRTGNNVSPVARRSAERAGS